MTSNQQKIISGRYQVVPRSIILIFKDQQVLLQKGEADKKIYPGLYNGIGGHIERGEDVLAAARRELEEEAGITCENLELAGTIMIDVNVSEGILLFVFTGDETNGELTHSEEGTIHWVDINQLEQFEVVEDVPELMANVLKHKETGQLFFGRYLYNDEGVRFTEWRWA